MATVQETLSATDSRMKKSVEALQRELDSIRTGRASPALVENVLVDYYGIPTPLNQLASISVPEARVLMIQPWDKQALKDVEKCLLKTDLGLVPNNDGSIIRINIPRVDRGAEERARSPSRQKGGGGARLRTQRPAGQPGRVPPDGAGQGAVSRRDAKGPGTAPTPDRLLHWPDGLAAQGKEAEVMEV